MSKDIGLVLNERYRTLETLGKGSYGLVYKVESIVNKKIYALKLINQNHLRLEELQLLKKLESPYLIKLEDEVFEYSDNYFCVVMEYCEKGDLAQAIKKKKQEQKRFSNDTIYNWLSDCIKGLHYLHCNKVIHRDIKPANLLLTGNDKQERIKIADLGASRLNFSDSSTVTPAIGTFKYMSPEMKKNEIYSYKTDVWSLGCVLYELITLNLNIEIIFSKNFIEQIDQLESSYISKKMLKMMLVCDQNNRASSEKLIEALNKIIFNNVYKQISFISFANFGGCIYLVENVETTKRYALKTQLADSLVSRSSDELEILMKLSNENIVSFIDSFYDGIMFCTVTEYCEGGNLAKKIKEKCQQKLKLRNETIFKWTNEMINGIYYLHYNGTKKCIHRDLQPRDDRIKIGNLEFSRSIDDDDSSMISTYAGTYKYTSPEIRNGQKYSFKTDVWSLGCIVYEIITLTSLYELIELNGCDLDRLIESLNTTDTLRPLIQQMLNQDPKKRASSRTLYKQFFIVANNQNATELNLSTTSLRTALIPKTINNNDQKDLIYNKKYKRLQLLGTGSSGCVYLVENLVTKKKFALKAIFKDSCRNSVSEELSLLIKLKSEYVISFEEFFDHELITFIVTEYCEDGDLNRKIQDKKMNRKKFMNKEIYNWIEGLTNGLVYLHSNHIIHRDIKPKNIFITKNGQIRLGDLGLSRSLETSDTNQITTYAGTFKYMSPEMRDHGSYSYNSDIWSAGCILFELITFQSYFDCLKLKNKTSIIEVVQEVDTCYEFKYLLKKMLVKDSEYRADSFEIKQELEKFSSALIEKEKLKKSLISYCLVC